MKTQIASVTIWVTAAVYLGFSLWLGIWPEALLRSFGIGESTPAMLTEIRAFYGGVEVGIAAAMVILWRRENFAAALLVGGLPLAGSASMRCVGMFYDGFSALHLALALVESVGALFCLCVRAQITKRSRSEVFPKD